MCQIGEVMKNIVMLLLIFFQISCNIIANPIQFNATTDIAAYTSNSNSLSLVSSFRNLFIILKNSITRKMLAAMVIFIFIIIIILFFIITKLKHIIRQKISNLKDEIKKKTQIQMKLLEEKEKFQSLLYALDDIYFEIDKDMRILNVEVSKEIILYRPKNEIIGKKFEEIFPKDKAEKFTKMIEKVFKDKTKERYRYYLKVGNEKKFFEAIIVPFEENKVLAIIQDISQEKSYYETLKLFSDIVQKNLSIIVITDTKGNIEYANPKFFEVTGYSIEEVMGYNCNILKSGKHSKEFYENLWKTIKANNVWHDIFINKKKNGQLYWENAYISPIEDDYGNIQHYFKVAEDITDLVEAENKLTKEKIKFETYLEAANVVIVGIGEDGLVKFINAKASKVLGYSKKEMVGKKWVENFIPQRDRKNIKQYFKALFKNKTTTKENKNSILCKSGEEKIILWQNVLLEDIEEGKNIVIGSGIDITYQEKENKIKTVLRKILTSVFVEDEIENFYKKIRTLLNEIFDANNMFIILKKDKETLQLVFNIDEKDNMKVLPKKKTLSEYVLKQNKSLYLTKDDILNLLREGKADLVGALPEVWIGIPLRLKDKDPIGIMGFQSYSKVNSLTKGDIQYLEMVSSSIAMAIKYKNDEKEKNDLLREVHHRVKNNIQYIFSMLKIQNRFKKNPDVISAISRNINRIKVMSFLQSMLYQNEKLQEIDIYAYFYRLVENLLRLYSKRIKFEIRIKNILFDYNISLPLGFIINELVSNSFIHAFDDTIKDPRIIISMEKIENENYLLTVSDNGIGLPKSVDMDNPKTFGLFFTKMQIDQIEGKLNIIRENGTKFVIKFKKIRLATFGKY